MSSEEIFEKVKSIIVEQLGVTETSVTMEASFIDDLGADSLDIVELIMALDELEKERGIKKDSNSKWRCWLYKGSRSLR